MRVSTPAPWRDPCRAEILCTAIKLVTAETKCREWAPAAYCISRFLCVVANTSQWSAKPQKRWGISFTQAECEVIPRPIGVYRALGPRACALNPSGYHSHQ